MRYVSPFIEAVRRERRRRALFRYLIRTQTSDVPHYRKSLFAHLRNTYDTLRAWGCPDDVCFAGLFHSIYGTQIFRHQTIPYAKRDEIRSLIGECAERLAYAFSVVDRPEGLLGAIRTNTIDDQERGGTLQLSPGDIIDLLLIECANLMDQDAVRGFARRALSGIRSTHVPLSEQTRRVLETCAR